LEEKLVEARRRADAQQANRLRRRIVELVRRIGRNIDRLARPHDGLLAAERGFQFAFEQDERLSKSCRCGGGPPPGGMCISMTQKRPAVSRPLTVMV